MKILYVISYGNICRATNNTVVSNMNCDKTLKCWLVAVDQSHEDIELPDGVSVTIGRSVITNIADTQVSRLHGVIIA